MQATHMLSPRWIAPIEPTHTLYEHHSLILSNDTILAIEPSDTARKKYTHLTELCLDNHLITPGFVNAHAHSPMVLLRSLGEDQNFQTWLHQYMLPAEKALLSEAFVEEGTTLAIAEMLLSGTTTFNEHYFHPHACAAAVKKYGIRACIGLWVGQCNHPGYDNEAHTIQQIQKLLDTLAPHERISYALAPHSPYLVSEQALKTIQRLSMQYHMPVHIHCQETQHEINESIKHHGLRPIERLAKLGLVNEHLLAVHMVESLPSDARLLQNAHIVTCPKSNLKLGSGICPLELFLQESVNIALGTDGAASNNTLDMLQEMQLMALLQKGNQHEASALPAWQALTCATLNGAKALGLSDKIGSLVPGKQADFIAIDLDHPRTYPHHDPIAQLVYAANSCQITQVWVAGQQLVNQSKLCHFTHKSLSTLAMHWQDKTKALS